MVNPARLDAAAAQGETVAGALDDKRAEAEESVAALKGRLDELDENWDGVAQASFYDEWSDEMRGMAVMGGLLEDIAHQLRGAARSLRARAAEERERQRREEERLREEERRREAEGGG